MPKVYPILYVKKVPQNFFCGTFCGENEIRTRDTVTRMQV